MLKLYFPATILMQYIDATSIEEVERKVMEGKVKVLGTLLKKDTHEDIHTTVVMPSNLKKYFRGLKEKLAKMVLGKDVILFFRKDAPIEIEAEDEYELVFKMNPEIANKLKIRKYAVAERFLATDMVFRLYYYMQDTLTELKLSKREQDEQVNYLPDDCKAVLEILESLGGKVIQKDIRERLGYPEEKMRQIVADLKSRNLIEKISLVKVLRDLERKITTFRQSARYETLLADYTPFEFPIHKTIMNVHYPAMLEGFIFSNFPLLSRSGVFQLAIMLHVKERRFEDFFNEFKHPYFDDLEGFVEECEYYLDRAIESYKNMLNRFINEVKAILEEKDPIEEFIKSCLPATFFDIYEKAKAQGFDVDEVMFKLRDLIRRGVVKSDGEMLKI